MDKEIKNAESTHKEKDKPNSQKEKSNFRWIISVFITTFTLSLIFSSISTNAINNLEIFPALIILIIVVLVGILFDMVAIAVTIADEGEFHAKATKKIPGSKTSVKLIRNSSKVANFCADVIGDICGVLSGSISALIGFKIANNLSLGFNVEFIIGAAVAAVTVAGKAIGKDVAKSKSTYIVHFVAKILNVLHLNKK